MLHLTPSKAATPYVSDPRLRAGSGERRTGTDRFGERAPERAGSGEGHRNGPVRREGHRNEPVRGAHRNEPVRRGGAPERTGSGRAPERAGSETTHRRSRKCRADERRFRGRTDRERGKRGPHHSDFGGGNNFL